MVGFTFGYSGQGFGNASIGGYNEQTRRAIRSKNNPVPISPTGASKISPSSADRNDRPTCEGNFFQSAAREETDPLPIGREKRVISAFGAGKGTALQLTQGPNV
jgi:hypothetical protein